MSHIDTGFANRLAYVRWLRARGLPACATDQQLADAAGVGVEWLRKWKRRSDGPDRRRDIQALCAYLNVSEQWLVDNIGPRPEPDLWDAWLPGIPVTRSAAAGRRGKASGGR